MFVFVCILLIMLGGAVAAAEPTNEQIRETVQRSIPYIEEKGAWWIEEKDCVSCHRVNTMIWSLTAAREKGFQVSHELDEWTNWATDASLAENDKGKVVGLGNKEGVAQMVLALRDDADSSSVRKELVALLPADQQSDGSWKAGGQLPSQKRAKAETDSVSTMWIALALASEGGTKASNPVVERALAFLEGSPAGESTEWYAVQLMLAVQRQDPESRDRFVKELRQQQQSDGGWGWLISDNSDALGTGLALYALLKAGVDAEDESVKRAQQFLVSTQRDDGSWPVHGTKAKKKEAVEETAVYWGTTWAALALMAGLGG